MTTKKQTAKQAAFYFFLKNVGYSYDPKTETPKQGRARCARELAKAERDARALGYTFEWIEDYDDYENSLGDHSYWCEEEKNGVEHSHEIYSCLVWDGGETHGGSTPEIVASLGAIIDPSREYRRVIEAELASEALAGRESK